MNIFGLAPDYKSCIVPVFVRASATSVSVNLCDLHCIVIAVHLLPYDFALRGVSVNSHGQPATVRGTIFKELVFAACGTRGGTIILALSPSTSPRALGPARELSTTCELCAAVHLFGHALRTRAASCQSSYSHRPLASRSTSASQEALFEQHVISQYSQTLRVDWARPRSHSTSTWAQR